jgi:hypothetical protein
MKLRYAERTLNTVGGNQLSCGLAKTSAQIDRTATNQKVLRYFIAVLLGLLVLMVAKPAIASAPSTQASHVSFFSIGPNSLFSYWTNKNGANRVVFMKKTACGNTALSDNTTYTANSTFGNGSQIGSTGWYCVFNGRGSSVSVSGLNKGETYRVQVFESKGTAENPESKTTSPTITHINQDFNSLGLGNFYLNWSKNKN